MLRDRRIVFTAGFLRAVANGLIGVLAGIYLSQLGFEPAAWGAVLGAGVAGTAFGAAGVMFWGDHLGRRRWLIALGVLAAADEAGLPCPDAISVVGFNDMPFVDRIRPALTTVRIPEYEIGRRAAALLLARIREPEQRPETILVAPELVVRDSTGPPA